MRLTTLSTLALYLLRAASATVFEATNEWQVVPEGYEIPGGYTFGWTLPLVKKEAKLPDAKDSDGSTDAVVFKGDEVHNEPVLKEQDQLLQETLDELELGHSKKLEEVADWAHDVEYGEKIASSPTFLNKLFSLISSHHQDNPTRELAARIFGASFRNNPAALDQLFPAHENMVTDLLNLVTSEPNPLVQSRLIYALGSLLTDARGLKKFGDENGDSKLQTVFANNKTPLHVKSKCAVLVEKLASVLPAERRDLHQAWSDLFQETLAAEKYDDGTLPILEALAAIHKQTHFAVHSEFIKWLASTAASSKNKDPELYEYAKSVRHTVFGNPNAQRKEEL